MSITEIFSSSTDSNQCRVVTPERSLASPIHGDLTFHDLMIYIAAGTAGVCCLSSACLSAWHMFNYTNPKEQKQLIRVIITPAVFALFGVFATWSYSAANYLTPIAGLYESFGLVALFMLLLAHTASPSDQDLQQREGDRIQKSDDLGWLNTIWIGVFQILPTRFVTMIALEVVEGVVCYDTKTYWRAHTAINIIAGILTGICLLSIIKYYMHFKDELHRIDPRILIKMAAFKVFIFVEVVQRIILGLLAQHHVLNGTKYLSYDDQAVGMNPFLLCIEAYIFALAFFWPFSARPYTSANNARHSSSKLSFGRALFDAVDIADVFRGIIRAWNLRNAR